ncbi:MAG: DUF3015 domain-containing protein [Gammaproteobacteria bacterium]|nr:DUF3015 domain-containing protein [Gammaproteobacteria bacterium]
MLKKTVLALGICLVLPLSAAHAANDGAGCGLGKVILGGKSGAGVNVGASILNSIYGNQTFAMTSGTSGCDTSTVVQNDNKQREEFVASNMDNLSVDAAQGQGNYLASLAHIMAIQEQDKGTFYSLTQARYEDLFVKSEKPAEVLAALDLAMASDSQLAKYIQ